MGELEEVVEATGADLETAIRKGLAILEVGRDDVQIEVLEEPSRGVFGIGARDARVRLTLKPQPQVVALPAEAVAVEPLPEEDLEPLESEDDEEAETARAVLLELLEYMGVENARVEARRAEADGDDEGPAPLLLEVTAPKDDLVGPQGETLDALQRITRLIVGREQESWTQLLVDVNGYRLRRRQSLQKLALRLAKQAVDTGRTVVLEPMPPDERRIVHLALRDHPDVSTESIGEGARRKVTIIPR